MPNHPSTLRQAQGRLSSGQGFTARIVKGSGKGREQGIPTLNLNLEDVPTDIAEGIYAARVTVEGEVFGAAMHYGPRPVHRLGKSFEAHLLGELGVRNQELGEVTIEIVKRLRDVKNFENEKELKRQIEKDIEDVKAIFSSP